MRKKKMPLSVGGLTTAGNGTDTHTSARLEFQYTTRRAKSQILKIRRADNVVIGEVRGDTYFKKIHDKHFLDKPRGIASDVDALRQAQNAGAIYFVAYHVESKREYRAPIARFFSRGIRVNRGYGEQLALVIADFNKNDEPTQPALFNLSRLNLF